ncbi:hypothetical protein CKO28_17475 [Rhodovibrio sodomensis]|uniref:Uncharacterized protein n=1 Tax=Rhodovibrio sodomensis TaxID=1088 RepID=A0ABS1DJ69_9PROT|nr:hypothetical protein [Rhodovibrio sodomensis]MBK1669829.1 hypothetical protein [Rhodovibrio sodomensis]
MAHFNHDKPICVSLDEGVSGIANALTALANEDRIRLLPFSVDTGEAFEIVARSESENRVALSLESGALKTGDAAFRREVASLGRDAILRAEDAVALEHGVAEASVSAARKDAIDGCVLDGYEVEGANYLLEQLGREEVIDWVACAWVALAAEEIGETIAENGSGIASEILDAVGA